jgi:hypothetical protein
MYGLYLRQVATSLFLILLIVVVKGYSQDLPEPTPHLEALPVGTIIIPMDDAKQSGRERQQFPL